MILVRVAAVKNIRNVVGHDVALMCIIAPLVLAISAATVAFSFHGLGLWFLPYIAFVPFFSVLANASSHGKAFRDGFFFGFVFFSMTIYWLFHVAYIGVVFCIAYCAFFYGLFALLIWHVVFRTPTSFIQQAIRMVLFIPLCGVALEYVRAEMPLLGFGWGVLGYSQASKPEIVAFARILGVYGLSAFVLFINTMGYALLDFTYTAKKAVVQKLTLLGVLVLVVSTVYGYGAYHSSPARPERTLRVALIQPNISQVQKWQPVLKDLITTKTLKLIELVDFEDPDVIILPEAAYPGALTWEFAGSDFEKLSQKIKTPVIIGAPNLTNDLKNYNSVFYVADGDIKAVHDKLHLVPFGEFVPFRPFFALFGLDKVAYSLGVGDFSFGENYTVFKEDKNDARFGVLICFEDTMPELARLFVKEGANILVNITNDAWFKRSVEPYQHLQAARLRAIENNCYLVRAANTGISAFIAPNGEVLDLVRDNKGEICFITGTAVNSIGFIGSSTFFQKIGYVFPRLSVIFVVLWLVFQMLSVQRKNL